MLKEVQTSETVAQTNETQNEENPEPTRQAAATVLAVDGGTERRISGAHVRRPSVSADTRAPNPNRCLD